MTEKKPQKMSWAEGLAIHLSSTSLFFRAATADVLQTASRRVERPLVPEQLLPTADRESVGARQRLAEWVVGKRFELVTRWPGKLALEAEQQIAESLPADNEAALPIADGEEPEEL